MTKVAVRQRLDWVFDAKRVCVGVRAGNVQPTLEMSSSNRNGTTSSASLVSAEWLFGESLGLVLSVGWRSFARQWAR